MEFKRKATYAVEGLKPHVSGHADFADDADFFFSFNFYVPQISQIYTDLETYSVFGMTQILSDEKNLRHLRNLRA